MGGGWEAEMERKVKGEKFCTWYLLAIINTAMTKFPLEEVFMSCVIFHVTAADNTSNSSTKFLWQVT